jgi:hypothetical protein
MMVSHDYLYSISMLPPCESKDYLCLINWLGSENLVNKNRACFDLNTSLFHEKQLFVNEMV